MPSSILTLDIFPQLNLNDAYVFSDFYLCTLDFRNLRLFLAAANFTLYVAMIYVMNRLNTVFPASLKKENILHSQPDK